MFFSCVDSLQRFLKKCKQQNVRGKCSEWMSWEQQKNNVEVGSIMQVKIDGHVHSVVYVGKLGENGNDEPMGVHLASDEENFSAWREQASNLGPGAAVYYPDVRPRYVKMSQIVNNRPCRINNSLDKQFEPFTPERIREMAERLVREAEQMPAEQNNQFLAMLVYDPHHFATLCRNGVGVSPTKTTRCEIMKDVFNEVGNALGNRVADAVGGEHGHALGKVVSEIAATVLFGVFKDDVLGENGNVVGKQRVADPLGGQNGNVVGKQRVADPLGGQNGNVVGKRVADAVVKIGAAALFGVLKDDVPGEVGNALARIAADTATARWEILDYVFNEVANDLGKHVAYAMRREDGHALGKRVADAVGKHVPDVLGKAVGNVAGKFVAKFLGEEAGNVVDKHVADVVAEFVKRAADKGVFNKLWSKLVNATVVVKDKIKRYGLELWSKLVNAAVVVKDKIKRYVDFIRSKICSSKG